MLTAEVFSIVPMLQPLVRYVLRFRADAASLMLRPSQHNERRCATPSWMSKFVSLDVAPASGAPAQGSSPRGQAAQDASVDFRLNSQLHAKLIKTKQFRASTLATASAALVRQRSGG